MCQALTLTQKASLFAMASRFVVVDDPSRSGHLIELQRALDNDVVTLSVANRRRTQLHDEGIGRSRRNVKEFVYGNDDVRDVVRDGCQWAEGLIQEIVEELRLDYPWQAD